MESKQNETHHQNSSQLKPKFTDQSANKQLVAFGKSLKGHYISNKARFLNLICSDYGICSAFGLQTKLIENFFEGFLNCKYAVDSSYKGAGEHGEVTGITFERGGFRSYVVMKKGCSMNEVRAAKIINNFIIPYYPNFTKFYGLITCNDSDNPNILQNVQTDQLCTKLTPDQCDTVDRSQLCVFESVDTTVSWNSINGYELASIIFQILFAILGFYPYLSHNDMHLQNILLSRPIEAGYFRYSYDLNGRKIEIDSAFIIKIIDFGICTIYSREDRKSPSAENSSALFELKFVRALLGNLDKMPNIGPSMGFFVSFLEFIEISDYIDRRKYIEKRIASLPLLLNAFGKQNRQFLNFLKDNNPNSYHGFITLSLELLKNVQKFDYKSIGKNLTGIIDINPQQNIKFKKGSSTSLQAQEDSLRVMSTIDQKPTDLNDTNPVSEKQEALNSFPISSHTPGKSMFALTTKPAKELAIGMKTTDKKIQNDKKVNPLLASTRRRPLKTEGGRKRTRRHVSKLTKRK